FIGFLDDAALCAVIRISGNGAFLIKDADESVPGVINTGVRIGEVLGLLHRDGITGTVKFGLGPNWTDGVKDGYYLVNRIRDSGLNEVPALVTIRVFAEARPVASGIERPTLLECVVCNGCFTAIERAALHVLQAV